MDVKDLIYIREIAREGSLSDAGRKLGVSQPTLSSYLSRLENMLGVDLFVREKKKMLPTAAGRIYLEAAEQMIQVKERTYQSIKSLTSQVSETIKIGATPLRGAIMVAQIFPQFARRFPNVKVEIAEGYMNGLRDMVKNGQVTFALGSCYDSEDSEFDYMIVSNEEVVLGVPSFHRLAHLASKDLEHLTVADISEFGDTPFVMMAVGSTVRTISDHILAGNGIRPTIVFESHNNLVLSNMIRSGAGVGFLPRSAMVKDAKDIVYFSMEPRYYIGLCMIMQKNAHLSEAARYLAYLVIRQDRDNPMYVSALNEASKSICREFEGDEEV